MFSFTTKRLSVRCASMQTLEQDAASVFQNYTGRVAESQFLARLPHQSISQTKDFLYRWSSEQSWNEMQRIALIIEVMGQRQPIGLLILFGKQNVIEPHFGISEDFAGQGLVSEMLHGLVDYLSSQQFPRSDRLKTYCAQNHLACQKVLLRNGFEVTGQLIEAYFNPNLQRKMDCLTFEREITPTR